ncbi:hypothetical protein HCTV-16_gp140 [Haloarcula virus HCTV-16]|nr:hypothetical protein HCTV-16_gp140 [Haloarcula virus HCTV-16]
MSLGLRKYRRNRLLSPRCALLSCQVLYDNTQRSKRDELRRT